MAWWKVATAAIGLLGLGKKSKPQALPAAPPPPEMSAEGKAAMADMYEVNDAMLNMSFRDLTGFDLEEFKKISSVNDIRKGFEDAQEQAYFAMADEIAKKNGWNEMTKQIAFGNKAAIEQFIRTGGYSPELDGLGIYSGADKNWVETQRAYHEVSNDLQSYYQGSSAQELLEKNPNMTQEQATILNKANGLFSGTVTPFKNFLEGIGDTPISIDLPEGKKVTFTASEIFSTKRDIVTTAGLSYDPAFNKLFFERAGSEYGLSKSQLQSTMSEMGLWNKENGTYYASYDEARKSGYNPPFKAKSVQVLFAEQLEAFQTGDLEEVDRITKDIEQQFPAYYKEYYDEKTGKFTADGQYSSLASEFIIKFKDIHSETGESFLPETVQKMSDFLIDETERLRNSGDQAALAVLEGKAGISASLEFLQERAAASGVSFDSAKDAAAKAEDYVTGAGAIKAGMESDDDLLAQQGKLAGEGDFAPVGTGTSETVQQGIEMLGDAGGEIGEGGSAIRAAGLEALKGQLSDQDLFKTQGMIDALDQQKEVSKQSIVDEYLKQSNLLEETMAARGIYNSSQANLEREKLKGEALAQPLAKLESEIETAKQQLVYDARSKAVEHQATVATELAGAGERDIERDLGVQKFNITNAQELGQMLVQAGLQEQASILQADQVRADALVKQINALSLAGKDIRESFQTELGLNADQAEILLATAKTRADVAGTAADADIGFGKSQTEAGGAIVSAGGTQGQIAAGEANAGANLADQGLRQGVAEIEAERANQTMGLGLIDRDTGNLSGAMQSTANLIGMENQFLTNKYDGQVNAYNATVSGINQQNAIKAGQQNSLISGISNVLGAFGSKAPARPQVTPSAAPAPAPPSRSAIEASSSNVEQQAIDIANRYDKNRELAEARKAEKKSGKGYTIYGG